MSSYDPDSAWWVFKRLQTLVDDDYDELHPTVRDGFDELYLDASAEVEGLEDALVELFSDGRRGEAREMMDQLVETGLMEAYSLAKETINQLLGVEGDASIEETVETEGGLLSVALLALVVPASIVIYYWLRVRK